VSDRLLDESREPSPDVRTIMLSAAAGSAFVGLLLIGFASVTALGGRAARDAVSVTAAGSPPLPKQQEIAQDASHPVGGQQGVSSGIKLKDIASDPLPTNTQLAESIRLGQQIFTQTPEHAPQYVGNALSCTNCHINGGQKEGALPLAGIAAQFPAFSPRDNRLISLEDRIRSCFARSLTRLLLVFRPSLARCS